MTRSPRWISRSVACGQRDPSADHGPEWTRIVADEIGAGSSLRRRSRRRRRSRSVARPRWMVAIAAWSAASAARAASRIASCSAGLLIIRIRLIRLGSGSIRDIRQCFAQLAVHRRRKDVVADQPDLGPARDRARAGARSSAAIRLEAGPHILDRHQIGPVPAGIGDQGRRARARAAGTGRAPARDALR